MGRTAAKTYHARMQRVLDHIDRHLDDTLDVEALSAVAAFSNCHFHRQFSALFGIGVHRYVQLTRMKRAAYRLAFRDESTVTEIALDAGYEAPEAFARAFKQRLGQTPTAFRKVPQWLPWQTEYAPVTRARSLLMQNKLTPDQIRIVDFPATPVAIMEHRGDPALIGETVRRFIAWRKAAGLPPKRSATFNLLHDDPDTTPPEAFRVDLCAATTHTVALPEKGVKPGLIPAGRCAVLRLTGSSDDLKPAATFLYARWLPESGEEMRDFPLFCQRVSFFPDVAEHEAVTDLFLPLV